MTGQFRTVSPSSPHQDQAKSQSTATTVHAEPTPGDRSGNSEPPQLLQSLAVHVSSPSGGLTSPLFGNIALVDDDNENWNGGFIRIQVDDPIASDSLGVDSGTSISTDAGYVREFGNIYLRYRSQREMTGDKTQLNASLSSVQSFLCDITDTGGPVIADASRSVIVDDGNGGRDTITSSHRYSADLNGDGSVDAQDAGIIFANWGRDGEGHRRRRIIDAADAEILFALWTGDGFAVVSQ